MPFQPRQHNIDFEVLRSHFHLPMAHVAEKFSMCLTFFKKVCRQHDIKRWPYRKVKSLEKQIAVLKQKKDKASASLLVHVNAEFTQLTGLRYDKIYTTREHGYMGQVPDDELDEEQEGIEESESKSTKRQRLEEDDDEDVKKLERDTATDYWSDNVLLEEGSSFGNSTQGQSSVQNASGSQAGLESNSGNKCNHSDPLIELLERDDQLQDGNDVSVSWDDLWQSCQKDFQNDNTAVAVKSEP